MNGPALPAGIDADALLRALFEHNTDALLLIDAAGLVAAANPAASALLGYGPAELHGLAVDRLVPDALRHRHAGLRAGYTADPQARPMGTQVELTARRKDGREVVVEISLNPLAAGGGTWVLAGLRDIGNYPRVRQAVRRAHYGEHLARLGRLAADARDPRHLLPQVPAVAAAALQVEAVVVHLLQPDRRTLRIAAAHGPLASELPGSLHALDEASPVGWVMATAAPLNVADYAARPQVTPPPAYLNAGLRSALGLPLFDRGRPVGVLMVHSAQPGRFGDDELRFTESIAHLLATCLQRAQSDEALSHAQRLESVGQLTGGIAHDFNNLLTVIQGNLQVLEDLPVLGEQAYAQQLVAAAARASRRGAELTGKLLAFSRRQVLQPTALDVQQMLGSLADMLRRTLDQRIRIAVDCAPQCPPVLADPGQLEAALLNIAINARDAMPDGGTLRFAAGTCEQLPAELRHELDDPSALGRSFVAIAIADTGSGMSVDVKERAFEPFFTTKEAGRGTGLGLSTVYGFVKQSKGVIAIDSAPGAGTTLTLYLPRPWYAPAAEEPPIAAGMTVPAGLHVLLVEDDADVRDVVRTYLTALGCQVVAASSGEQALLALSGGPAFDLLLSDIALGAGMRGTQLAAIAHQRFPRLAVLLMSGYSSELLAADRDAPAEWDLLRKPYTRAQLAQAMARVIAQSGGDGDAAAAPTAA